MHQHPQPGRVLRAPYAKAVYEALRPYPGGFIPAGVLREFPFLEVRVRALGDNAPIPRVLLRVRPHRIRFFPPAKGDIVARLGFTFLVTDKGPWEP